MSKNFKWQFMQISRIKSLQQKLPKRWYKKSPELKQSCAMKGADKTLRLNDNFFSFVKKKKYYAKKIGKPE